jgi:non-specific serine/threonine protein kinase
MTGIPVAATSFVGRRRELSTARRLLGRSRLLTLTGVGGVGKSRLAMRLASDAQRMFADGVCVVELAPLRRPDLLVETVADALGLVDRSTRTSRDALCDRLRDKRMLLVLDNCEHLLSGCAALAKAALRVAPGLKILVTSRQALNVDAEQIMQVPPLSVPDHEVPESAAGLMRYESVALLSERAAAVLAEFTVTEDNRAAVARLCQRLDGIPLAIELAAVRLRELSPHQLAERLTDRFRLLDRGRFGALPQHQSLRGLIDWSYQLCSPQERSMWARMSVFAGGVDLDAAEEVCRGADIPRDDVLDLVAGLVDRSVVSGEESDGRVRYRMLETIREYGRQRLAERGANGTLRRAHRNYFRRLAEQAGASWFGPHQVDWYRRLRAEHANLRTALDYCLTEPGETGAGLRMASALAMYWFASAAPSEGRHWLTRLLGNAGERNPERVHGLVVATFLGLVQGQDTDPAATVKELRRLAEQAPEPTLLAHVAHLSGWAAVRRHDLARAAADLDTAVAGYETAEDLSWLATALRLSATVATARRQVDRAVALCQRCIALCEAHGEQWYRSFALWNLGTLALDAGDHHAAVALERDSLRCKRGFNDGIGIGLCLDVLSRAAAETGDVERAAILLGQSHTRWTAASTAPLPGLRRLRDECEERTRRALGERTFRAAFHRGARLSLDQGIAYALDEEPTATPSVGGDPAALTPREAEVADLVARGLSNKAVADRLVISARTVESHVDNILTKLGFSTRAQIAAWAAERRAGDAPPG